ncbi:MAG TPA: transcription elongation factor [Bacteroidia bacterium]|nr:transcription elongation factor [Bacteroidia bacterium]
MQKAPLIDALVAELRTRYDRLLAALEGSREAATGADTKAENKYDTRGLEASYLAAGQADQADELLRALHALESFEFRDFDIDDPVETGALVEVEQDDELRYFLLAPAGGGVVLASDCGETVTVLGPGSPLAGKLLGTTTGTFLDDPGMVVLEVS